jgi:solute carrier family 25 protein 16
MSAHLLRNDGSKPNIMTTTAAQTNSASNIIPDHDVAMDAKKEGNKQSPGKKRTDKKSTEYLIKSGLAGGFAGCAVRLRHTCMCYREEVLLNV